MKEITILSQRGESVQAFEHRIVLPGGEWALWKWAAVRGAGFPASGVLNLTARASAAAFSALQLVEEEVLAARSQALEIVSSELDNLRREDSWHDRGRRGPLMKALKLLSKGRVPDNGIEQSALLEAFETLRSAQARRDTAEQELETAFALDQKRLTAQIEAVVRDEKFQEAVVWQNRRAFHTCIQSLMRNLPAKHGRGTMQRQHEEMVASYLQRYSVKNDSIGFFGPIGWALLSDEQAGVTGEASRRLLAGRNLYFEVWCIDALAKAITEIPGIKLWLAPRILPFLRVESQGLCVPSKGYIELPEYQVAILRACNGQSPKAIATKVLLEGFPELQSEQDVYDFLDLMESSGVLAWGLDAAVQLCPELSLREQILSIEEEGLRTRALRMLDQLEDMRDAVRTSAGSPEKLDCALSDLEDTFTRLTGRAATRGAGQVYAARTLVFEDCQRDLDLKLGSEIASALAPPLSLLLASARWFTYEAGLRYRCAFASIYDDLVATGRREVDFISFMAAARPLLFEQAKKFTGSITALFQEKWAAVLGSRVGGPCLEYSSDQLEDRVRQVFHADRRGWNLACYHSPDVMIAADGIESIRRGEYFFVLGELHPAMNTLDQNLFVAQHPDPDQLQKAARLDVPVPVFASVISKVNTHVTSGRLMRALLSEKDYRIHCDPDYQDDSPARVLRASDLMVVRQQGELFVVRRDQGQQYAMLDVLKEWLNFIIADGFKMLAPAPHCPRVKIDKLVVCRESWHAALGEAEFVREKSALQRFKQLRRWASARGVPRFTFVKLPAEEKPFYLDLDSPIYADIFCRLLRQELEVHPESQMSITEMLPTHDQLWLTDDVGNLYTNELRMVAVDLRS